MQNPFGEISAPPAMNIGGDDPVKGVGILIGWGIAMFITVAGFFLIMYLLWGALDWIMSGGEKEKIVKAQSKITQAIIGMLVIFISLTVFVVFAGKMLGIVEVGPDGAWSIKIPFLQ